MDIGPAQLSAIQERTYELLTTSFLPPDSSTVARIQTGVISEPGFEQDGASGFGRVDAFGRGASLARDDALGVGTVLGCAEILGRRAPTTGAYERRVAASDVPSDRGVGSRATA